MVKVKKDKKNMIKKRGSEESQAKPLPATYISDDVLSRKVNLLLYF